MISFVQFFKLFFIYCHQISYFFNIPYFSSYYLFLIVKTYFYLFYLLNFLTIIHFPLLQFIIIFFHYQALIKYFNVYCLIFLHNQRNAY